MTDVLLVELLVDGALIGLGVACGWIVRGSLDRAHRQLQASDRDLDRFPHVHHHPPPLQSFMDPHIYCRRCGRMDGSHTSACERSRLDDVVPARRREEKSFSARGHGYAGADGQDLPQSDGRTSRAANFGTTARGKGDAA